VAEITRSDVISYLEKATMLEVFGLVKEIEERFDVKAMPPQPVVVQQVQEQEKPKEEEKTEFSVVLKDIGDIRIQVIKTVRAVTTLGLKEAKELVDRVPVVVTEGMKKEDAEAIKKKLEDVGAVVELK